MQDMTENCTYCGAELEMGQIGLCDSCQESKSNDERELESSQLPINTDAVFTNAPDHLGALWSNLCSAENSLAEKLHSLPIGTAACSGMDVWFLHEDDGKLNLVHANLIDGKISEMSSRFDISLEWVDVEEESIQAYVDLVVSATENFQTVFIEDVANEEFFVERP
jgi:hypothetical protein